MHFLVFFRSIFHFSQKHHPRCVQNTPSSQHTKKHGKLTEKTPKSARKKPLTNTGFPLINFQFFFFFRNKNSHLFFQITPAALKTTKHEKTELPPLLKNPNFSQNLPYPILQFSSGLGEITQNPPPHFFPFSTMFHFRRSY